MLAKLILSYIQLFDGLLSKNIDSEDQFRNTKRHVPYHIMGRRIFQNLVGERLELIRGRV